MIFITGDVHCPHDVGKLNSDKFPDEAFTKNDYLIVCGDTALVWDGAEHDVYWQNWFEEKNFTTLFVDGNHENHDLLNKYPVSEWHGGKVHFITPSVIHLMRGQIFEIKGSTFLALGGAESHDKWLRKEGKTWWATEVFNEADYLETIKTLKQVNNTVDFVISHDCPSHTLKEFIVNREANVHSDYMERIYQQITYKHWYFGHHHFSVDLSGNITCLFNKIIDIKI